MCVNVMICGNVIECEFLLFFLFLVYVDICVDFQCFVIW